MRAPAPAPLVFARRAAFAAAPLLLALGLMLALTSLAVPVFFMQVLDRVIASSSTSTLAWLLAAVAIALVVQAALEALRARAMQAASDRLGARLDPLAFAAAAACAGARRADGTQPLHDAAALRQFAASPAACAGLDLVLVPPLLLVLLLLHPLYALVAASCAVLLLGLNLWADAATRRGLAAAEEAAAEGTAWMAQALRAAEAVVAMGMLPALARRWRAAEAEAEAQGGRGLSRARAIAVVMRAARMLMTGAMVATGVLLVIAEAATPGSIIAASLLLTRLLHPFEQIGATMRAWAEAAAAFARLRAVIAELPPAAARIALPCRTGVLEVERLVFLPAGAERAVLRGLSFRVQPGEVLAILGPSGAGKSTLLRLLVGMETPTAGHVQLDGYAPHLWQREDLARHVGYMPQHAALTDATIAETIARLAHPDPALVIRAAREAGLHGVIARLPFGYATLLREAGPILSDGQRQRLSLARALYGAPRLVLLDEPNAHLDADGEAVLAEAIAGVRRRGGAVVLATHRRGLVEVADSLLVLRDGLIDRQGARGIVLQELARPPVQALRRPQAVPA
jgi:ATP-binding cassette subfamily C protein